MDNNDNLEKTTNEKYFDVDTLLRRQTIFDKINKRKK